MNRGRCLEGIVAHLLLGASCLAQVDPPLQVPIPPFIDRGVREIVITPGSAPGLFHIRANWDFEGFELTILAGETRDMSTIIRLEVNGQVAASVAQTAFILPDSGHFCDQTPCAGQVCGTASDGLSTRPLYCRESITCRDFPAACDCRCGDTVSTLLAFDRPLQEGDVLRVTLERAPGALAEFTTEDDSLEILVRSPRPGLDFDGDRMHTLADYAAFQPCMTEPSVTTLPPPCPTGDFDGAGSVDLYDFSRLQLAFTGTVEPCVPTSPRLTWPLPGRLSREWVVTRHVDLDPTLYGSLDYTGNSGPSARTYDGHRGTDIEVPTFRAMDKNFPVLAAAPGWVEFVRDSEPDRNTSCSGRWNVIAIRHANRFRSLYGHLKQNSAVVQTGDFVVPGQPIAAVGSSGCSAAPQVHFELRNCQDEVVDPYLVGLFDREPPYNAPLGLMDAVLTLGPAPVLLTIKDPPPDVTSIPTGQLLGFGLSLAGGAPGDVATVQLRRADGSIFQTTTFSFTQFYQHSYWSGDALLPIQPGDWTLEIRTNGHLDRSYPLTVIP